MTRAETVEEVEFLMSLGEPAEKIARRLGIHPESVARSLHRAGRPDLARKFRNRRGDRHRKHNCADCGAETWGTRCRPCDLRKRRAS